ncbi:MAG: 2-methoxy-6-polyprenyl-1,4-benzoquinol methylase, mitochondrial [Chlamydiales bacterium]|nr:2-methoxy-6-polyprenyl-1,4-benzoquinol methylase, mitochondrial [Chlamydiales bacterium]MCH9619288.1 2-methoxy-6-polyprenyl-1,4-benzoquinol methylase, mitochondrial [Chlamydiales bacterium]MCH9622550.1 2-methoxy-6-polyprenyl-1,4-benzoquinol methylase, mitochondrial [Chlamydiales bacterium]
MKHFIWKLQSYSIENHDKVVKGFLSFPVCLNLTFVLLSSLKGGPLAYILAVLSLLIILAALFFLGIVIYTYSFSLKRLKKKMLPSLIKKLRLKGDEKILDIESLRGMLPILLAKQLSNGKVESLIRPSTKKFGLKQIKKIIKRKKIDDKIEVSELGLSKLPFPDNHFDIVTSSFFFHKILKEEEEILIEEMLRVLKPNGQFFLFDLISKRVRSFNEFIKESVSSELEFSSRALYFEYYLKYSREEIIIFEVEDCPGFIGSRLVWGKNIITEKVEGKPRREIKPPWVVYPGYSPCDGFWRQSGEYWFYLVWYPYWASLSEKEQKEYLEKYKVTEEWWSMYFDPEHQKWLDDNVPKDSPAGHILRM